MSYFINFPTMLYNFNIGNDTKLLVVRDIALNVRVHKEILENIVVWDEYDIEDGETPDTISEKLYGKPDYHWTLMLLNQRYDYIKDWPMTEAELMRFIEKKYGLENIYTQHKIGNNLHWTDSDGNNVSKLTADQFALFHPGENYSIYSSQFRVVNNYDFEYKRNESLRRIRVLNSTAAAKMVQDLQDLMNG